MIALILPGLAGWLMWRQCGRCWFCIIRLTIIARVFCWSLGAGHA